MKENELIKALRELKAKIEESQVIAEKSVERSQEVGREVIAKLIENQPELYGKGGTQRNWLVREAEKFGLDEDFMASDIGPYNQPNE